MLAKTWNSNCTMCVHYNVCELGLAYLCGTHVPQGRQLQRLCWRGVKGELCSLCCSGMLVLSVAVAAQAASVCDRVWCEPCMQCVQAGRVVCLQPLQQCVHKLLVCASPAVARTDMRKEGTPTLSWGSQIWHVGLNSSRRASLQASMQESMRSPACRPYLQCLHLGHHCLFMCHACSE